MVGVIIIIFDNMLIVAIVQRGNLPMNCMSTKLLKFPPLPNILPYFTHLVVDGEMETEQIGPRDTMKSTILFMLAKWSSIHIFRKKYQIRCMVVFEEDREI